MSFVNTILVSGKRHSGKSTLAKKIFEGLEKKGFLVKELRFAEEVYAIDDLLWKHIGKFGYAKPKKSRGTLQVIGTELGRAQIDNLIWINIVKEKMKKFQAGVESFGRPVFFIIEDCRFKNEFDEFPGAISIRLECSKEIRKARCEALGLVWDESKEDHQSETDLDSYVGEGKFGIVLDSNSKDIENIAKEAYEQIKIRNEEIFKLDTPSVPLEICMEAMDILHRFNRDIEAFRSKYNVGENVVPKYDSAGRKRYEIVNLDRIPETIPSKDVIDEIGEFLKNAPATQLSGAN